jgi:hypothetical protein
MLLDSLEFGTFQEIEPNIMEIIIHEGVELRESHIDLIEKGLVERYGCPYALLINRVNSYSHTHASMQRVAQLQNMTRLAILVHGTVAKHAADVHKLYQENLKVFDDREKAIIWLRESIVSG